MGKFRFKAINDMGSGAFSAWSSTVESPNGYALGAPNQPAGLTRHVDNPVGGTIKIAWDPYANEAQAGGDALDNVVYEVMGGQNMADTYLTMSDPTLTEHSQYTATIGSTWTFKVRARNRGGQWSAWSTEVTLVSGAKPSSPTLSLTSTNVVQVVITWSPPANGGSV